MNPGHEWKLVDLDAVAPHAWRNGGGATRELLTWPSGQVWKARISLSEVTSPSPFPSYPNVERWFALVEGPGLMLRVGGGAQRLGVDSPAFHFAADAPVDYELMGAPTLAFNLISEPRKGRMVRVPGEFTFHAMGEAVIAVYAHSKPAHVGTLEQEIEIPPRHLAWQHRAWHAHGTVRGDDALWMEVRT